jgi:hypothetical protein
VTWQPPTVAATAAPGTVSPRTVAYAGQPGRRYVLFASRSTATDPITGVTDSAGNAWTRLGWAPQSGSVGRRIEVWTCAPAAAFASVAVAFTGTGTCHAALIEVVGADVVDVAAADFRAASTAPAALTVTPTVGDGLALAAVHANANTTAQITAPAGWAVLTTESAGPKVAYRLEPTAGVPVGPAWTLTTSVGSGHAVTVIKQAAGTPPPSVTVTVWDGAAEQPATVEGVWDGTTIQPASIE